MIREDRELLAGLARLNRDMAFLGMGAVDPVPAEGALMAATAKVCEWSW
ncbi:MAG: hypothetical protein M3Y73_09040 [Actinomycetota bacterium]|nr:hypothetical protein [Actinomycetota bacterium]